jgi:putative tryptophan/tyrosine transport system substrate-binding protein
MRRREFVAGLGGAAAWPLAARAQQMGTRRVGILVPVSENDPYWQARLKVFLAELQKLGWAEGRNVRLDYRWTGADPENKAQPKTEGKVLQFFRQARDDDSYQSRRYQL